MYKIRFQRYFLKLAANGQNDKAFLLSSEFCPKGLSAPAPAPYTCGKNNKKNVYKIRIEREKFLKLATNGRSDKSFLLTSQF